MSLSLEQITETVNQIIARVEVPKANSLDCQTAINFLQSFAQNMENKPFLEKGFQFFRNIAVEHVDTAEFQQAAIQFIQQQKASNIVKQVTGLLKFVSDDQQIVQVLNLFKAGEQNSDNILKMLYILSVQFEREDLDTITKENLDFVFSNMKNSNEQLSEEACNCMTCISQTYISIEEVALKKLVQDSFKQVVEYTFTIIEDSTKLNSVCNLIDTIKEFYSIEEKEFEIKVTEYTVACSNIIVGQTLNEDQFNILTGAILVAVQSYASNFNKDPAMTKQIMEKLCTLLEDFKCQEDFTLNKRTKQMISIISEIKVDLNRKKAFLLIFEIAKDYLKQTDPRKIAVGYLILKSLVDYTKDQLQNSTDIIVTTIENHLEIDNRDLIFAMGFFITEASEELNNDDFTDKCDNILAVLINKFRSTDELLYLKSISSITQQLSMDKLQKILPELADLFINRSLDKSLNPQSRELCINSIICLVIASDKQFSPYSSRLIDIFEEVFSKPQEEESYGLFIAVIDLQTQVIVSMGKKDFMLVIKPYIGTVVENWRIQKDNMENAGKYLYYFSHLSQKYQSHFTSYFKEVNEFVVNQVNVLIEQAIKQTYADETKGVFQDEEKNNWIDYLQDCTLYFSRILKHSGALISDDQYKSIQDFIGQKSKYIIVDERIQCFFSILKYKIMKQNNWQLPAFQNTLTVDPYDQEIQEMWELIFKEISETIKDTTQVSEVKQAIGTLNKIIRKLGSKIFANKIQEIYELVQLVLKLEIACMEGQEDEESESLDIEEEMAELIQQTIENLSLVLQEDFMKGYIDIFPLILEFIEEEQDDQYKLSGYGTIAIVFENGHKSLVQHSKVHIFEQMLGYIENEETDEQILRNIVFAFGMMIEKGREYFSDDEIKKIYAFFISAYGIASNVELIDNLASSMCRIIRFANTVIPYESILTNTLKIAPFKNDKLENYNLIKTVEFSVENWKEYADGQKIKFSELVVDCIANSEEYEIKKEQVEGLKTAYEKIRAVYQAEVDAAIENLGQEQKENLKEFLQ